uniref:Tropomyosin n=1 Tax=Phlebotomus papatasi TaxID=29031 RepID=A0A1B0D929_PHLPP
MDAIKKKMQAMKLEKDNALDRALICEQQARDANLRAEKAEEEARNLQKKIQTVENDLDQTQEALTQVNTKLEEKNKNLQNREVRCYASRSQRRNAVCTRVRKTVLPRCPLGGDKNKKLRKEMSERNSTAQFGAGRKRGHQHHPRQGGVRRSNVPSGEILAQLRTDTSHIVTQENTQIIPAADPNRNFPATGHDSISRGGNDGGNMSQRLAKTGLEGKRAPSVPKELCSVDPDNNNRVLPASSALCDKKESKEVTEETSGSKRNDQPSRGSPTTGKKPRNSDSKRRRLRQAQEITKQESTPSVQIEEQDTENDPEAAEWAKLRCTSERTEVVAEREYRRQNRRCADYPGLAFGRSIFSSDTMMKFSIIRNELHNIMKTQLKRVGSPSSIQLITILGILAIFPAR